MSGSAKEASDSELLAADKALVRRTRNLQLIPPIEDRRGGKVAYGEWCHVIGIFQALLAHYLPQPAGNHIVDAGCGTGLVGIACDAFVDRGGMYTGIDVSRRDVDFCRGHYPAERFRFVHLESQNAQYAPDQPSEPVPWPVEDNSQDMVTALSLWTHLGPEDATFYFHEVNRVLKPGATALLTFFVLDDVYEQSVPARADATGRYHTTKQTKWLFTKAMPSSPHWRYPAWADPPEQAIGVTREALDEMMRGTRLRQQHLYHGNWKEQPGAFFQDIAVFTKAGA